MDQHKEEQQEEEEEDHSKESMEQHKEAESEEEDASEEWMDRRTEEKNSRGLEDVCKTEAEAEAAEAEEARSSDEEEEEAAMAAWSLFAHACSVLQCVVQAWDCRLGLLYHDSSFGDPKPAIAAPADSSPAARESAGEEEDTKTAAGFYIQEVITRVRAVRIKPPPPPPAKGRERRQWRGASVGRPAGPVPPYVAKELLSPLDLVFQ